VSSFTINEERLKEIDFTDAYFDSNQAVVTLKSSSYKTADDLAGMKVGAQSGTTGEAWALENIPDCELVPFDAITESMQALMAGKVEAVVFDLPAAVEMVNGSFTDAQILIEVPTGEQYGIVVSKDNPNLTIAINEALAELRADGTYDTIYNKYFEY
ncbi:MAG: amino acid ABC transporter substrate-binding protein, partial [Actinobacteria bacterium]|nr:amino acid ABC transporter substrate-binding protein [Actinomycetota bacterium]